MASENGQCTVIVGCQWGDEGKGKVVDVLAQDVDVVARYQGGANAGHTVQVGDDAFILHQIPSGILHPGKRCLLGNGVVLDALQFFEEYDALAARGIELDGRVGVSERAHLLLPYHKALDRASEDRATQKIGTTGRGIGPAYEEKAGRRGVRVADLRSRERAEQRVREGLERALQRVGVGNGDLRRDVRRSLEAGERLLPLATDTGAEVTEALASGKRILLEGAQGTALDLDHGTYPFVTSSNTTASGAGTGVGVGPTAIDAVVGVVKAYTTRVGNGPLPTGFEPEMDRHVRDLGDEYGATTGRPRRCGWFDAVLAPLLRARERAHGVGRHQAGRARHASRDRDRHRVFDGPRREHRRLPRRHVVARDGGRPATRRFRVGGPTRAGRSAWPTCPGTRAPTWTGSRS